jgi:hypothetical protein
MDIFGGAGIILSLIGGYLLILAVCGVIGAILSIPAAVMNAARVKRRPRPVSVDDGPNVMGWGIIMLAVACVVAALVGALVAR